MELSRDDIITILNTVRESGYQYFNLEVGDLKVTMGESAPVQQIPEPAARPAAGNIPPVREPKPQETPAGTVDDSVASASQHILTAPVVGVFYRSPAPDEPPYVKVGDHVNEGDTVGVIEVMKVYNSVACDITGTVIEILAEDNKAVEYGQSLLVIEPDAD